VYYGYEESDWNQTFEVKKKEEVERELVIARVEQIAKKDSHHSEQSKTK